MNAAEASRAGSGAMFDAIAERYDLLNRVLSLGTDQGWRRKTVDALEVAPGALVLDLATGTGDMAFEILARHPNARVLGIDPSREMLRVADRKAIAAGLRGRIELLVGDAEELPLRDASVDAVCMAFGIRNVVDRPRALREIARVTRPNGKVAILELSEPQRGVLAGLARFHIRQVVPRVGALLSGSREYRYLQASIAAFPPPNEFAETMRSQGLDVTRVEPLTFGVSCLYVATPAASPAREEQ